MRTPPPALVRPAWLLNPALRLLGREHVLGFIFYACAAPDRHDNTVLSALAFGCAIGWSWWDGVFPPRLDRWPNTIVEGAALYVGAVCVSNILLLIFGPLAYGF